MADKNINVQVSFGISGMERQSFQHLMDEKVFLYQKKYSLSRGKKDIRLWH